MISSLSKYLSTSDSTLLNRISVLVLANEKGEILFLDPPFDSVKSSQTDQESRKKMVAMTALLCNRDETGFNDWAPEVNAIKLSENSFKDRIWKSSVKLTNRGDKSVAIVRGQTSCGCLQLDFHPAVIPVGASVTYDVQIEQDSWGDSSQKLRFVYAIGLEKFVDISGATFTASSANGNSRTKPTIEKEIKVLLPFEITETRQKHLFRFGLSDRFTGQLASEVSAGGASVAVDFTEDHTGIFGHVSLEPQFVKQLSLGLP